MNRIVSHHGKIDLAFGRIHYVPVQVIEVQNECRGKDDVRHTVNPNRDFHGRRVTANIPDDLPPPSDPRRTTRRLALANRKAGGG